MGSKALRDLTGVRFQFWTVLDRAPNVRVNGRGYVLWRCRCDCGTERNLAPSIIINRRSNSCGCTPSVRGRDLTGQAFGSWIVVERSPKDMNEAGRSIRWHCRCKCGQEKHVRASTLRQGRSTSCGCESRERWRRHALAQFNIRLEEEAGRPVHRYYLNTVRLAAEERGLSFSLTREQIEALLVEQEFRCALTGVEIGFPSHERACNRIGRDTTASLNRIDATHGYEIGNVWWVHKDISGMRMDLPRDRFVDLCRMVAKANS